MNLHQEEEDSLETDGNNSYRECQMLAAQGGTEVDVNLCREIGAQLAILGDKLEREGRINQEIVSNLIDAMLNESLSEERFSKVVRSLVDNIPPGIEQEKAEVAIAMILTKKVASSVPALLQRFFQATSNLLQRNYLTCLQRLASQR
ncbi:hypothetical protein GDO86_005082 [Hymenochirus boettgeri]|uniref:BH3-interacting domain death agonist n=1 Tax=Hymenochirus boettgeri TaxID=247094 RepID=A0A8T2J624_9PIPI|nr:hypothetical protein GDO86_005082 [Hymenochirus boettgeri]